MMTHPKLIESQCPKSIFALFYGGQCLCRYGASILKAG